MLKSTQWLLCDKNDLVIPHLMWRFKMKKYIFPGISGLEYENKGNLLGLVVSLSG